MLVFFLIQSTCRYSPSYCRKNGKHAGFIVSNNTNKTITICASLDCVDDSTSYYLQLTERYPVIIYSSAKVDIATYDRSGKGCWESYVSEGSKFCTYFFETDSIKKLGLWKVIETGNGFLEKRIIDSMYLERNNYEIKVVE